MEPGLRQELAVEITKKVTKTVRAELEDEYQQKLERETGQIREELTLEIAAEQRKIAEAELRPVLLQKLRYELEPKLEEKIRSQLTPELRRAISKELHVKVKEELRQEMEETIRENVRLDLIPILTAQLRENLQVEHGADDFLTALFNLVCEALGEPSQPYSVDAFVTQTRVLANGVLELTRHFRIGFSALLRFIMDLEAERAHLDQLHTQTRSLLVRQAQVISELRQASDPSLWASWTKNVYEILTGTTPPTENLAIIRNDIVSIINKRLLA
jgi:hypothetical protein